MAFSITENCNGCTACKKICPVNAIDGKRKETHIIDAKVCISCGACGRTCPAGAIADESGNLCARIKRSEWAKPHFDTDLCVSCKACVEACPVSALACSPSDSEADPREYPFLSKEKACIACCFCAAQCPVEAVTLTAP